MGRCSMTASNGVPQGWSTGYHEGYYTKVIKYKNATIEINRPILTPEEQAKAEARVIEALKVFGATERK